MPGLDRLEDLLLGGPRVARDLRDRRRPPQLLAERGDHRAEAKVQLLHAARHAYGPALVAEMPLELADDGRRRIGGELETAVGIEAVDCLDQADRCHLHE